MRGMCCGGLVRMMALFFFLVAVASPAQCRAVGSTNATAAAVGSTAALGSKGCDIVFCTKTRCNTIQRGWEDCYCCEPLKPNAPCYRTRDACMESCPVCNASKCTP